MALSEEIIGKRLSGLNTSQDSIQTASLWVMHYKDSAIDKVTKCWMDVYKKADDQLRIALIYVMNDVVQRVNKKERGDAVKMAFHPHVVNACGLASSTVKKPIIRVIDVFAERGVYPPHIIEEMRAAAGVTKRRPKDHSDFDENITEVDHCAVIREIESYYQNEELTEKARNILDRSNFNFKEKMQDRMKDRTEGTKILSEMDESKNKLFQFLNSVERHQNKCQRLVELLKSAKSSLSLQLRDVTIVDDAYEKFASGILETKKQLDIILKTNAIDNEPLLENTPSPMPSSKHFNEEGSSDDMEMDEDDVPPSANTSLILPKDYIAPVSSLTAATSTLDPRLQRLLNQNKPNLNFNEKREIESCIDGASDKKGSSTPVNDPRQRSRAAGNDKSSDSRHHLQPEIPPLPLTTMIRPLQSSLPSTQHQQIFSSAISMNAMSIDLSMPAISQPSSNLMSIGVSSSQPPVSIVSPISPIVINSQNSSIYNYPRGAPHPTLLPPPHLLPPPPDFSMPPPFISPTSPPGNSSISHSFPTNLMIPQVPSVSGTSALSQASGSTVAPSQFMSSADVNASASPVGSVSRKSNERVFGNNYQRQPQTPGHKRKYSDDMSDNSNGNANYYDHTTAGLDDWNNSRGCDNNQRWEKRASSFHSNNSSSSNWKRAGNQHRNSGSFRK